MCRCWESRLMVCSHVLWQCAFVFCACATAELVEDLRSLKQQAAQLRPLHTALTQQFVEVYGAEGAGDLAGGSGARAAAAGGGGGGGPASASAAAAASSGAAAMADADAAFGGSSVTQQINLATLRAQQADEPEFTAAIPAAAASSGAAGAAAAPAAPTASSMNISEEAASDFF